MHMFDHSIDDLVNWFLINDSHHLIQLVMLLIQLKEEVRGRVFFMVCVVQWSFCILWVGHFLFNGWRHQLGIIDFVIFYLLRTHPTNFFLLNFDCRFLFILFTFRWRFWLRITFCYFEWFMIKFGLSFIHFIEIKLFSLRSNRVDGWCNYAVGCMLCFCKFFSFYFAL